MPPNVQILATPQSQRHRDASIPKGRAPSDPQAPPTSSPVAIGIPSSSDSCEARVLSSARRDQATPLATKPWPATSFTATVPATVVDHTPSRRGRRASEHFFPGQTLPWRQHEDAASIEPAVAMTPSKTLLHAAGNDGTQGTGPPANDDGVTVPLPRSMEASHVLGLQDEAADEVGDVADPAWMSSSLYDAAAVLC